jgi:hypothetical protein
LSWLSSPIPFWLFSKIIEDLIIYEIKR